MTALDEFGCKWNNLVVMSRNVVLFLPCKTGQTSIKAAISVNYDYATPDVIAARFMKFRRVAAFRHPVARLCSAWRDKARARTFPHFVDWLLTLPEPRRINPHFRPQVENWTTEDGRLIDLDDVVRTETLQEDWARVWGGPVKHLNRGDNDNHAALMRRLSPGQRSGLKQFYAADYQMMSRI